MSCKPLLWISACALFGTAAPSQTIAFTHAPDGGAPWPVEDIYSIDGDGTSVRALTHDGHSHHPAWLPDGQRILFIHDSALQVRPAYKEEKQFESYHPVELCLMDRNGGNRHLLRRLESVFHSAAWSPDGKTLAISGMPDTFRNTLQPVGDPLRAALFLLPADAQGEPRLLFRNALTPSWSPDGKKLAFSIEHPRGQWAVHVADSDGSHDRQLTEAARMGGSPAWSPDGKQIAFDQFAGPGKLQIFVMEVGGSHERQVTTDSTWSCQHPSWSADGKQLVFSCRSASNPCGTGLSSAGPVLPACARRLFVADALDGKGKPVPLSDRDGATPAFAPIR